MPHLQFGALELDYVKGPLDARGKLRCKVCDKKLSLRGVQEHMLKKHDVPKDASSCWLCVKDGRSQNNKKRQARAGNTVYGNVRTNQFEAAWNQKVAEDAEAEEGESEEQEESESNEDEESEAEELEESESGEAEKSESEEQEESESEEQEESESEDEQANAHMA